MEGNIIFFVYSDAGYGQTVRAKCDNRPAAELKAGRLVKKGHTDIEICEAQIIKSEKFEAKA